MRSWVPSPRRLTWTSMATSSSSQATPSTTASTVSEIWTFEFTTSNGTCAGGARGCDGYDAVGNFDDDDEGEVVIVRQGEVFVIGHDGVLQARVPIPVAGCVSNESGPPTVADFDGDGRAEIGTAGANFYVVVDLDCIGDPVPDGCDSNGILWKVPNNDCSSRATGSSVFDFEGDGSAEVVYADEQQFPHLRWCDRPRPL